MNCGRQYIQQGVSNGLPDVDFVFYSKQKSSGEPFDIRFDEHAPKVTLPQGMMVPINSFNSVFHCNAFGVLRLPVLVSTMASDVIRGYWAQRLVGDQWLCNGLSPHHFKDTIILKCTHFQKRKIFT